MSTEEEPKPHQGEQKNDARNGRLVKMRKVNEEVLRKKLQNEARDKCSGAFQAFGKCAQEQSLMVVFACRKENRAMSDCLEQYCSEAEFEKYLTSHGLPLPAKPEPWYTKYVEKLSK